MCVDLGKPVEEAVIKGHFPGVLAVREAGLPVSFPFEELVRQWATDANKTRQMIIAKVGSIR